MGVTVSFSTVSALVRCLILFACVHHAQSILMGKRVVGRDEDVGQGECNRDPRTGQAGQVQACAKAASQALAKF